MSHRTTLKLNFQIDSKLIGDGVIQFQSRCMSDSSISDIDSKNVRVYARTTLNIIFANT